MYVNVYVVCVNVLMIYALKIRDAIKVTMNSIPVEMLTTNEPSNTTLVSYTTST